MRPKRSLVSAWDKLGRAKKHFEELVLLVEEWTRLNTQEVTLKYNAERRHHFADIRIPAVPSAFSLVLGDIAHNLRSALDHIAFQFDSHKPTQRYFPFYRTRTEFSEAVSKGIPGRFPKKAWAIIETVQSCKRPYPHRQPLFRIHELDRRDKHQTLNLISTTTVRQEVTIARKDADGNIIERTNAYTTPIRLDRFKLGAIRWAIAESVMERFVPPNVDVYGKFTPQISLDESEFGKGEFLIQSVKPLLEFTERTLTSFVRAYPSLRRP